MHHIESINISLGETATVKGPSYPPATSCASSYSAGSRESSCKSTSSQTQGHRICVSAASIRFRCARCWNLPLTALCLAHFVPICTLDSLQKELSPRFGWLRFQKTIPRKHLNMFLFLKGGSFRGNCVVRLPVTLGDFVFVGHIHQPVIFDGWQCYSLHFFTYSGFSAPVPKAFDRNAKL